MHIMSCKYAYKLLRMYLRKVYVEFVRTKDEQQLKQYLNLMNYNNIIIV